MRRAIRRFLALMVWEFEGTNLFLLGFIVFVVTVCTLYPNMVSFSSGGIVMGEIISLSNFQVSYISDRYLLYPDRTVDVIEALVSFLAGILFASNVARGFENRELLTLLTCPVKRTYVILSKFFLNFLIVYFACSVPFVLDMLLLGISPLSFEMYVWLFLLSLPILFMCSIALFASVMLRMSASSAIVPPIIYLGLTKLLLSTNRDIYELLHSRWDEILFNILRNWLQHSSTSLVNIELLYILIYRLLLPTLLVVLSTLYFQKMLQLD